MVVIYDNNGKIWYNGSGIGEPVGLPFLNVEIPDGKYVEKIDTTGDEPKPIFKEYPKSEMEILKERIEELEKGQTALIEGAQSAVK